MPLGNPSANTLKKRAEKERKVFEKYILPQKRAWHNYGKYKYGMDKAVKVKKRKLLVVGTGRCGTQFLSQNLIASGYDVPHEMTGKDGVVSHWFVCDSNWYPFLSDRRMGTAHMGERRSDYSFENIYHLVRDPLRCIASMSAFFNSMDYEFLLENGILRQYEMGYRKMHKSAIAYLRVNEACEKIAQTRVKIEDVREWYSEMCLHCFGLASPLPSTRPANKGTGIKTPKHITYSDIAKFEVTLSEEIKEMARRYGYSFA